MPYASDFGFSIAGQLPTSEPDKAEFSDPGIAKLFASLDAATAGMGATARRAYLAGQLRGWEQREAAFAAWAAGRGPNPFAGSPRPIDAFQISTIITELGSRIARAA